MLIKCSECGNQVSDQAVSCPHCGAPIKIGCGPSGTSSVAFSQGTPVKRKSVRDGKPLRTFTCSASLLAQAIFAFAGMAMCFCFSLYCLLGGELYHGTFYTEYAPVPAVLVFGLLIGGAFLLGDGIFNVLKTSEMKQMYITVTSLGIYGLLTNANSGSAVSVEMPFSDIHSVSSRNVVGKSRLEITASAYGQLMLVTDMADSAADLIREQMKE